MSGGLDDLRKAWFASSDESGEAASELASRARSEARRFRAIGLVEALFSLAVICVLVVVAFSAGAAGIRTLLVFAIAATTILQLMLTSARLGSAGLSDAPDRYWQARLGRARFRFRSALLGLVAFAVGLVAGIFAALDGAESPRRFAASTLAILAAVLIGGFIYVIVVLRRSRREIELAETIRSALASDE